MGVDYFKARVANASREELKGFVHYPMHPRLTQLAITETKRRQMPPNEVIVEVKLSDVAPNWNMYNKEELIVEVVADHEGGLSLVLRVESTEGAFTVIDLPIPIP